MIRAISASVSATLFAIIASFLLVGCVPPETSVDITTLLSNFDENANKLPQFKAEGSLKIEGFAGGWMSVYTHSEDFTILLSKNPSDPAGHCDFALYVLGDFGDPIFGMGSSVTDGMYYLFAGVGQSGMCRVGRIALANAPGVKPLSLDISGATASKDAEEMLKKLSFNPLQLVSAFAIIPPSKNLTTMPGAILEMQGSRWPFEYVLTCLDRQGSTQNIIPTRRMIFEWKENIVPALPHRIEYLDTNGAWVMTAKLANFKPADVSDMPNPPAKPPVIPTRIQYTWRDSRTGKKLITLTLDLEEVWSPGLNYSQACKLSNRIPKGLQSKIEWIDGHIAPRPGR